MNPAPLGPSHPRLDQPDDHRAHRAAGQTGDERDDRDQAKVHATLFLRAGRLVLLLSRRGCLGVRKVPVREDLGRMSPKEFVSTRHRDVTQHIGVAR